MAFYFSPFNAVGYAGQWATNIMQKVKLAPLLEKYAASYYTYTLKDGERADNIAADYYGDDRLSWVIYVVNNIVDPYYDWHLPAEQFKAHIIAKYGSIEAATEKVMFYRVNWASDDRILTTAAYDALPANTKKYWNAVLGHNNTVVGYDRKPADWVVDTNKTIEIDITPTTGEPTVGERIRQFSGPTVVGEAFITSVLTTVDDNDVTTYKIDCDKVSGTFSNTTISNSGNTFVATVTDVNTLNQAIPLTEVSYWESVDAYTYEEELNEAKRTIRLLDAAYISQLTEEFKQLLA